uniref:Maturase MatK N-terminal domain-containing protein n=1 Tax=Setaria viridis TaxID=4556 RepID=A0A4U6UNL9_SETVI|nr:hypothetical protein SEVIR_5G401632v2 [Setaria viridis]
MEKNSSLSFLQLLLTWESLVYASQPITIQLYHEQRLLLTWEFLVYCFSPGNFYYQYFNPTFFREMLIQ